MARLRLAFMGTPEFALPVLAALLEAGHEVVRVYARAAKPAGRGGQPRLAPVHAAATAHGIAVETPASFAHQAVQHSFAGLEADAAVVAAYGLILPPPVLAAPRFGCLNVHASLLPRWRGAAPIQRAIMAGEAMTGVCVMRMDEGLDTGPVLLAEEVPIGSRGTAGELHDELARRGAALMVAALDGLAEGRLEATPQAAEGGELRGQAHGRGGAPRLAPAGGRARAAGARAGSRPRRLVCHRRGAHQGARGGAGGGWRRRARDRPRRGAGGGVRRRRAQAAAVAARRAPGDGGGRLPARLSDLAGNPARRGLRTPAAMTRYKLILEYDGRGFPIAPGTRLAVA